METKKIGIMREMLIYIERQYEINLHKTDTEHGYIRFNREMKAKEIECTECEGRGEFECADCTGNGECSHCGEGSCPECSGEGRFECEKCHGLGEIEIEQLVEDKENPLAKPIWTYPAIRVKNQPPLFKGSESGD